MLCQISFAAGQWKTLWKTRTWRDMGYFVHRRALLPAANPGAPTPSSKDLILKDLCTDAMIKYLKTKGLLILALLVLNALLGVGELLWPQSEGLQKAIFVLSQQHFHDLVGWPRCGEAFRPVGDPVSG